MFCGEIPCECNAKPKKVTAPRAKKKAVETVTTLLDDDPAPVKSGSMREAMKAVASKNPQSNIETLAQQVRWNQPVVSEKVDRTDESDEMDEAIRVLYRAGLLHEEEVRRFPFLSDPRDRAQSWKARFTKSARKASTEAVDSS